MLKRNKLFFTTLLSLMLLNTISATGLVINNLNYSTSKFSDSDSTFTFDLTNSNAFSMYNITFKTNNYVSMPIINVLDSAQTVSVTAIIKSAESFNEEFIVNGVYYTDIGSSDTDYNVDVDFYNGESLCDFTTIVGDNVIFNNKVNDAITLRNSITNINAFTIPVNSSYTLNLDYENVLSYYFLRVGYPFGSTCTITTLPTTGYVNNPDYNAIVPLNISIKFYETQLEYTLYETNYTINPLNSEEGILLLKNIGNYDARNISLYGDWFSFSDNNFNLEINRSKAITYTLSPKIAFTNQTNMTYNEHLFLKGNFNEIKLNFSIYIPFRNIDNYANTSNYDSIISAINEICRLNPNFEWCDKNTYYSNVNQSNGNFNVTFSAEQVKGIFNKIFEMSDELSVNNNFLKEKLLLLEQNLSIISNNTLTMQKYTDKSEQKDVLTTILFLILGIIIASGGVVIFMIQKNKEDKKDDISKW